MKRKHKQMLLITGCAVACIVLVAVIGSRFGTPKAAPALAESTTETESVTVEMESIPEKQETSTEKAMEETSKGTEEIVIQTESVKSTETNETNAVVPVQTNKEEQAIQPSPEKPTTPPEEVLNNPAQKPDGEKVEGTPVAEEHEAVVQPSKPPAQAGEPQAGDTHDGQIYIPGFGWVENNGGGGSGTVVEDMYENGNKIGIMD
ncbi:DUF6550 family protein [Hungatella effluvii]|uniref:DUF6550 family protein n=1 Tax=Hungatella effluvii TaxID=1096246 RepID=UPI0022E5A5DA|nr:DUF6550 family protein [Hungatella effluvii]